MPFDPLNAHVLNNPYPYYAWLREHDPVHWGASGEPETEPETEAGCWYITCYEDVLALLKEPRLGREIERILPERAQVAGYGAEGALIREWVVLRDPPYHTYLRALVQRAFTPQVVARWRPRIQAIARTLVRRVAEQGRFDLLQDVAQQFPVLVVAELLGVPPEDTPLFRPWTQALAAVIEFEQTPAVREQGRYAVQELSSYLRGVIAQRRRHPQDDLISALLALDIDPPLSEEALLGTCTQLLFGGNEPVTHQIGNGLLALIRHPSQMSWLRRQPDVHESAVDELLRYNSSVQLTFRYVLEDMTWRDKTLRTGDLVALVFGAANRDPAQFNDPDHLHLLRSPNRHLSLGQGIHYCLGAALARVEGQVMFDALLHTLPPLRLDIEQVTWRRTVAVRGMTSLPIACTE